MKKLLAMVLALVMTLSLAVSANAAFKDVKDIDETYAESAAVLNGLGVFKGYEEKDGTFSFQPKNAITRAEVAAIVYRIYTQDVKDTYVKNYETYNKFGDMAGAGWAKGYIGYCANAALVKGYPNGTFVPSGKVTGYEVLAMILRAVGYDQKNEFTGADWALHVAEIAERQGILDNVKGVDLNAPATREVVAELLFQAIQVPMVTYTAAFGYQNVSLNEKADNKIFAKNKTLGDAFNLASYKGYITYNAKKEAMVLTEKGEKTADDVIVTVADQDVFDAGRYGHVWATKTTAITDVFYDDSLLATKYESWNTDWITKNKTDFIAEKGDMNYFLNGNEDAKASDIEKALAVKGAEKALYDIDADGDIDTVIVINPIVDVMTADYLAKNDKVKIQGKTFDKDEVSGYEELAKDDVFTYVDMVDGVRYFEELTAIAGQKSAFTEPKKGESHNYITFAGKDYEQSGLKGTSDEASLFSKIKSTFDKDGYIYVDRGGFVVYTSWDKAAAAYAMVIDAYSVLSDKHDDIEYYVNLLLTDGTETGYVLVDEDCVDAINDKVLFPDFTQVKASKNTYIGQPAATGNYIDLGTLVEYTVKDKVYTLSAFNECDREYLDDDYTKGAAAMDFYTVGRKAVIEDTVAFYFYGTPNSTNFEKTPSKKVDVHYGVNTGKYNKDTNEAGIPSYADGTDVRYLETSGNNKVIGAVVFAGMPMGEYEDFVYLFKCEKETWSSSVGQLYTYYGVTSDGEVKEFESYDASRVGTVCYYFLRNDKTYDFAPAPYETDLVSVELLGNKDTVEYRYEGQNTESNIYSNLDKVYDLTDTSDLKAGDKVDTYDWKWQTTKVVEGMLVVDEDGDVECLFVLDDDVTFGQFKVNGQNYWYPVANYNGTKLVERALADLDNGGFKADKNYHIDGAAAIKGDAGFKFEAGKTYNVVECVDMSMVGLLYDNTLIRTDANGEYVIVLPAHEEFDANKVSAGIENANSLEVDTAKQEITFKSIDGVCTKTVKYNVTNEPCDAKLLSWTDKKTFDLKRMNNTLMVDLKGNKDVTVKNLEDILYVAHSDDSKCAFAKFEIYNSTYGEKADPAARTTKLEVGMPDLVVVVTAEDGTTAEYFVKIGDTTLPKA